jgi:hypothetical protein
MTNNGEDRAMTFEQYMKEAGVVLYPWQIVASRAFLQAFYPHRAEVIGKTFLVENLLRFLDENGNTFELEGDDSVLKFAAEMIVEDPLGAVVKQEVSAAYLEFCERNDLVPAPEKALRRGIVEIFRNRFVEGKRLNAGGARVSAFVGLRLREEDQASK